MKLARATLTRNAESPFDEPKMTAADYDLEILKSDGIGILRAIAKKGAGGRSWDFPLSSVSCWQAEAVAPVKK